MTDLYFDIENCSINSKQIEDYNNLEGVVRIRKVEKTQEGLFKRIGYDKSDLDGWKGLD